MRVGRGEKETERRMKRQKVEGKAIVASAILSLSLSAMHCGCRVGVGICIYLYGDMYVMCGVIGCTVHAAMCFC